MLETNRKKIEKVCIANRGEIACRIIRACKKLGMRTVVLYSEPDAQSLAVKLADEAYALGGTTALESYLSIDKVIAAAKRSGADALHPGYGLLSENADLAEACHKNGIIFVGPSSEAIEKMGMKNVARSIVVGLNLPVVPGYNGDNQSLDLFKKEAKKMGLPVLLKAAAGGGGKGMQVVEREDQFDAAWASAQRNAKSAFGDDTLIMEKYFTKVKHIEIQILGDQYGKILHLFERECSIQRRHQKIIEESPSLLLSPQLRSEMGKTAVAIARAVSYVGAGTMEFILDTETQKYYFLEMNTRIQVEHVITEEVVGIDLVEWQLKIAQGIPLNLEQDSLSQKGHAIECRLCAEDWQNNFMPASGVIHSWYYPAQEGLRVEHGIENNSTIGIYYDSMMAKIVTYGRDRQESILRMKNVLSKIQLLGVTTNQPLLAAILSNPEFIHGNYDTGFIPRHIEQIKTNWTKKLLSLETNEELLLAAWLFQMEQINNNENKVWKNMGLSRAWRNNRHQYQNIEMEIGQQKHTLWYQQVAGSEFRVSFGNTQDAKLEKGIKLQASNSQKIEFEFKDKRLEFSIRQHKNMMFIHHPDLGEVIVSILPRLLAVTEIQNKSNHVAPMPGKIIKVMVRAGDKVKINDELIIIESMKMENCVKASTAGLIKEVCVSHGQLVEKNEQLIRFESEG